MSQLCASYCTNLGNIRFVWGMFSEFIIDFVKTMLALSSLTLSNFCESCSELLGNTQNYTELFRVELNQGYFIPGEHWLLELTSDPESYLVVKSAKALWDTCYDILHSIIFCLL